MLSEENILILIPAFNEEGSIGEVIREIRACLSEPRILVVNDGSTDRTAERSREAGALVATHPFNLGVGTALQTGYKYAVRHGFQSVIQLDADGQHPPSYLPAFVKKLKETDADLVVGSRFLVDHGARIPFVRRIGNRIFAKLLTVLTGESLTDPTSGYRAMKRSILQFCVRDTYGFDYPDADFLLTLHRSGFRVVEIPIEVKPRRGGASQHRGLRPVFYVLKMLLSIFIILLRKKSVYQR